MDSVRLSKVARLIQKELSSLFLSEARHIQPGCMITVTMVRVSPDLSVAKVYLSLFGVPDKQKLFETIQEKAWEIRKKLGDRIYKQLRVLPNLVFYHDDSLDYAERIDELLKK